MNKLLRVFFATSAVVGLSACQSLPMSSASDVSTPSIQSNWVHDRSASDMIVRGGFGTCWGTGFQEGARDEENCPPAPQPEVAYEPAPQPTYVPPEPEAQKVSLAADALFDFNKSHLKPEGRRSLDDLVAKLGTIDLEVIVAVGHTDSIGSTAYNEKLSIKRAEAVKAYLVSKGVPSERIYTEGKGETSPVADNKTRAGRAKNRRVEVEVVGTTTRR